MRLFFSLLLFLFFSVQQIKANSFEYFSKYLYSKGSAQAWLFSEDTLFANPNNHFLNVNSIIPGSKIASLQDENTLIEQTDIRDLDDLENLDKINSRAGKKNFYTIHSQLSLPKSFQDQYMAQLLLSLGTAKESFLIAQNIFYGEAPSDLRLVLKDDSRSESLYLNEQTFYASSIAYARDFFRFQYGLQLKWLGAQNEHYFALDQSLSAEPVPFWRLSISLLDGINFYQGDGSSETYFARNPDFRLSSSLFVPDWSSRISSALFYSSEYRQYLFSLGLKWNLLRGFNLSLGQSNQFSALGLEYAFAGFKFSWSGGWYFKKKEFQQNFLFFYFY